MTNAAVADAPVTQAEPQADQLDPNAANTQAASADDGTDSRAADGQAVQTDADADDKAASAGAEESARLHAVAEKANEERIRAEERDRFATEAKQDARKKARDTHQGAIKTASDTFGVMVRDMRTALVKADHSEAEAALILAPLEARNGTLAKAVNDLIASADDAVLEDAQDAILQLVAEDKRAAFAKDHAGQEIAAWIVDAAEHKALESKAVKGLGLDDFLKLSPKANAAYTKALADEFDKGRDKGRVATPPDGSSKERNGASGGPRDLQEAEQMHAGMHPSGRRLSNDEMRAWKAANPQQRR